MKGKMNTDLGQILISPEVIAKYAGETAYECFGIVGMAMVSVKDGLVRLLKKDSSTKGINVVIDENNEPIIVEEDVILEDILNSLASISKRIDDIQLALIKNDDVDTSSDLDISKIDF